MELLILTPQLPYPPHQGTSLRNFNIIRGLAINHRITLLSFKETNGENDPNNIKPLADCCHQIITIPQPDDRSTLQRLWQMVRTRDPDLAFRLRTNQFELALRRLLSKYDFDIVQVEGIELAWTIAVIRNIHLSQAVVFDAHNAEAILQERAFEADLRTRRRWPAAAYSWVQGKRLRNYEQWACSAADWVTTVSQNDKDILLSQLQENDQNMTVIPNSIDVLALEKERADYAPQANIAEKSFDLVFTGKMDYRPNVDAVLWFADEVWPKILAQRPNSTWVIVGQKPHQRLAPLSEIPGITVTGWVKDVHPYLLGGKVFIMPFRVGSGTRLKLIEAMAAGLPVVSTAMGVEGYPVRHKRDILLAENSDDMASGIRLLLKDPDLRLEIGKNGRQFARNYDWREITPKFDEVFNALVEL